METGQTSAQRLQTAANRTRAVATVVEQPSTLGRSVRHHRSRIPRPATRTRLLVGGPSRGPAG